MSQALQRFLLLLLLTCMWSPSFLFIKLAIADIPIFTVVALRVTLAALLMGAVMLIQKRTFPSEKSFWGHCAIFAFLSSVLPFVMFCYAEKSIESALAAILNGTTPMFTALLAHLFIPSDRLDSQKSLGIVLSIGGMLFLFLPSLQGIGSSAIGMGAAALGAFSYAVSHVYAKRYFSGHLPFVAPTAQLLVSALLLIPLALCVDKPFDLPLPSVSAMLGVGGLSFLGTFLAFIIYYRLLEISGPTAISMTACFFPVVGMLLGYLFLGEFLTASSLGAAGMILVGIVLVNKVVDLPLPARALKKEAEPS